MVFTELIERQPNIQRVSQMNMYVVQPGYPGPAPGEDLNNSFSDVVIDWLVYC